MSQLLQEVVVLLYKDGLSSRQVADLLRMSKSVVAKMTKGIRGKSEANRLRRPATSTHPRSSRAAARRTWERAYGSIPYGHHIHHKDGNHANNKLENLEILDATTHAHIHHPPNPVPRGLRPARQQYMKEYRAKTKQL